MEFATPDVPDAVRRLAFPGYVNVFSMGLGNRNLWGTESLFGDWSGHTLLLAQDFYPALWVANRARNGHPAPYSHNPEARTNRRLQRFLVELGVLDADAGNLDCGFLYASACFLLKDDPDVSAPLRDLTRVLGASRPAVTFTIDHMPNLRRVIALGRVAGLALGGAELSRHLGARGIAICYAPHPSRGANAAHLSALDAAFKQGSAT